MNLILLGAPGAGKGTQGEIIRERLDIPTISTGVILREAIKAGTPLGQQAKAIIDQGGLVPDEVVNGIVRDRLAQDDCKNGFILDGFPRTLPQAQALDQMGVPIDKVLYIQVPDALIEERLGNRRVCEGCGALLRRGPLRKMRRQAHRPQGRQAGDHPGAAGHLPPDDRAPCRLLQGAGQALGDRRQHHH